MTLGCEDRPADVLVLPHLTFARVVPDGIRASHTERVCLDFAVINALGAGHWSATSGGSSRAAEAYEETQKQKHQQTEERCAEAGLRFWLVVLEHQGGMTKGADAALRVAAAAVATHEGKDQKCIREEMLELVMAATHQLGGLLGTESRIHWTSSVCTMARRRAYCSTVRQHT